MDDFHLQDDLPSLNKFSGQFNHYLDMKILRHPPGEFHGVAIHLGPHIVQRIAGTRESGIQPLAQIVRRTRRGGIEPSRDGVGLADMLNPTAHRNCSWACRFYVTVCGEFSDQVIQNSI